MPTLADIELLSVREAADRAGVSEATIWRALSRGELTRHRKGLDRKRVWVDAQELERVSKPRREERP